MTNLRSTAKQIFLQTLQRLELDVVLRRHVRCADGLLQAGKASYPLSRFKRVCVVAVGKAAAPMAEALVSVLLPEIAADQLLDGVVVSPAVPARAVGRLRYLPGGHPFPDARSLAAAEAVLEILHGCDEDCLVFFLVSGGASSMLEKPLDARMTLEDVASFHRVLVHSGLPIGTINVLRKHFSAVKGGRLAVAASAATKCTLLVSDVPPAALHVIGSGPTLPDPSTVDDCRAILESHRDVLPFDQKVLAFFSGPTLPETPKEGDPAFRNATCQALLSSDDLCRAAAELAFAAGFHVEIDNSCDEWPFDAAAAHLLHRMHHLRRVHEKACLLSAGEISVKVGPQPGTGGRNQHFVLECARRIAEAGEHITVLSAGSDGIDGNSPAAGAIADEQTVARAAELGCDVAAALQQFNSYSLLNALGDTIITGPTGNNLRDLRILLASD